ncbi:MAG: helix-turn-helix transcriptional regulator [Thermoanaerobaculia bacterium]
MRKRKGRARLARNPEIEARAKLLGPALRVLRQRKQRTQIALCKEIEVTKGMLSGYETGRQLPSLESLLAVLAGLDCDFQDLQAAIDYLAGKSPTPAPLEEAAQGEAERVVGGAVLTLVKHLGLHFPLAHRAIELSQARTAGRKRMG